MSIIVENLSYIYMKGSPYEKAALKDINLTIGTGEFVGIIGHTGSGKSTLVQHFNGLLKPSIGRVLINDTDVSSKNLRELRRHVGLVFQYPEHQLFEETVFKDVAFGLNKLGLSSEAVDARVRNAIGMVGLSEEVLEKSPFELSGGQKRRVAIAGVLVMNPGILVLDEPTAGLDPKGRDGIYRFVQDLHKDLNITIILVSHSMEDVARLVDRVIVMNQGGIEMDGPTREIFGHAERLESIGLAAPQITYLIKGLKGIMPDIGTDVFTVADAKREIIKHLKRPHGARGEEKR